MNDIVSTSCRHRYPLILRLHRLHRRHSRNQKYAIALLNQRKFYMILAFITIIVHDVVRRNQKSARNDVRML